MELLQSATHRFQAPAHFLVCIDRIRTHDGSGSIKIHRVRTEKGRCEDGPAFTRRAGEIGQRLAAVAICNFRRARQIAEYLLERKPKAVHGRVCESYAVPVSMFCASVGMNEEEALEVYHRALSSIASSEDIESDSDSLLQEIMLSQVQRKGGERKSVLHMLRDRLGPIDHTEELEHVGIFVDSDNQELLLNRGLILRYLLPSEWKGKRIDTLLNRLPGARRVKKKFEGLPCGSSPSPELTSRTSRSKEIDKPTFEEQAKNPFA